MIFGGAHYSFGTVLEESAIPLNLRREEYLEDTGEIDIDDLVDSDIIIDEEEEPPKPKPTRYKKR